MKPGLADSTEERKLGCKFKLRYHSWSRTFGHQSLNMRDNLTKRLQLQNLGALQIRSSVCPKMVGACSVSQEKSDGKYYVLFSRQELVTVFEGKSGQLKTLCSLKEARLRLADHDLHLCSTAPLVYVDPRSKLLVVKFESYQVYNLCYYVGIQYDTGATKWVIQSNVCVIVDSVNQKFITLNMECTRLDILNATFTVSVYGLQNGNEYWSAIALQNLNASRYNDISFTCDDINTGFALEDDKLVVVLERWIMVYQVNTGVLIRKHNCAHAFTDYLKLYWNPQWEPICSESFKLFNGVLVIKMNKSLNRFDNQQCLLAVDIDSGALIWKNTALRTKAIQLRYENFVISPLFDTMVCVAQAGIVCLDLKTGQVLWEIANQNNASPFDLYESLSIAGDVLFCKTADNIKDEMSIVALDLKNGKFVREVFNNRKFNMTMMSFQLSKNTDGIMFVSKELRKHNSFHLYMNYCPL